MLNRTNLLLTHHMQAAAHSLNLLRRKPLSALMTFIVIAIALALPALFWVCTDNLSHMTGGWQQSGHISLYLKPTVSAADQKVLLKKVQDTQGVGQATLKSSAQGLVELTQQEGMHDIMRYLPENPLPPVIEVIPALSIDSPAQLDKLSDQLKALPQIAQAKLDMEWITRLHAISGLLAKAAKALMILLALAVVLIIGTTLRLTIQSRHEEIQILKLIGAADSFIVRPFLYSGVWYGLAGAIIAVFLVNLMVLSVSAAVNQLALAYQMHYPFSGLSIRQILMLTVFAIILGWLGARLSVHRQMASIEPYN